MKELLNDYIKDKNGLIVIGLNDINKVDNILKILSYISKNNDKNYLYQCYAKDYFIDNPIEELLNDITEYKENGCNLVIINNCDLLINQKSLISKLNRLCNDMNIIIFIDNSDNSLLSLDIDADLIIAEKDNDYEVLR